MRCSVCEALLFLETKVTAWRQWMETFEHMFRGWGQDTVKADSKMPLISVAFISVPLTLKENELG
jgi:hypothetical protein